MDDRANTLGRDYIMNRTLRCLGAVSNQTRRNLRQTWGTQVMTIVTVILAVLIFSFFFLLYTNMLTASASLDDELSLTVYFDKELEPAIRLVRRAEATIRIELDFVTDGIRHRIPAQVGRGIGRLCAAHRRQ